MGRSEAIVRDIDVLCIAWGYPKLEVYICSTKHTIPNKKYCVEIYEQEALRFHTMITWTKPEVNVSICKERDFPISMNEYNAYRGKNIRHIFSVKIFQCD